ncbi:hypothetical protein BGZ79_006408 [Entomortierella chlamydospora]|nr:hypothetical protein BGZ79_006408 [Entomortierella chlamydospora]
MSEVTTLLAWLIPVLVVVFATIAWRVYIYKTRGPSLPPYLQRNVFARTASFIPRTLSFGSSKSVPTGGDAMQQNSAAHAMAIRNETRIDMSEPASQSFAPVPCKVTPASSEAIPVSHAVSRLVGMQ